MDGLAELLSWRPPVGPSPLSGSGGGQGQAAPWLMGNMAGYASVHNQASVTAVNIPRKEQDIENTINEYMQRQIRYMTRNHNSASFG